MRNVGGPIDLLARSTVTELAGGGYAVGYSGTIALDVSISGVGSAQLRSYMVQANATPPNHPYTVLT